MARTPLSEGIQVTLNREHFQQLFDVLIGQGYQVVGPTVRDNAIVYDTLTSINDLPIGWIDEQEKATYRLTKTDNNYVFNFTVGPHAWKQYLHPSRVRLYKAQRVNADFDVIPENDEAPKYAFIGVRACEFQAIEIQDRVFLQGDFVDPIYEARREQAFIVVVNCGRAGNTCFCASMGTGPKATGGFDLALTEVLTPENHYFVVELGSQRGIEVMKQLPYHLTTRDEKQAAASVIVQTAAQMGRQLETEGLKELLYRNYENPRWDNVAARCLTCGNCTQVCPTCFCTNVEDVTDLTGEQAERNRVWDSCFTMDFSYIHGGSVRYSNKARYRQWMTHKLATWVDQFGTFGCVGCGRCITWCPVGIDLTEEVRAIRDSEGAEVTSRKGIKDGR